MLISKLRPSDPTPSLPHPPIAALQDWLSLVQQSLRDQFYTERCELLNVLLLLYQQKLVKASPEVVHKLGAMLSGTVFGSAPNSEEGQPGDDAALAARMAGMGSAHGPWNADMAESLVRATASYMFKTAAVDDEGYHVQCRIET